MGIFSFIKRQLIDVIEWRDDSPDTLVYEFDDADCEIKNGAQLIVRDSQKAVFLHEGELGDVFGPGRYELTTQNIPILTSLKSWKYGFDSPFKCDVFFVSTRQFANQKWGTQNPIMMRDADFGMLRLRAFGMFSFRVGDPAALLRELSGAGSYYRVSCIVEHLRSKIVSGVSDAIAESKIPALDLSARYDELSELAQNKLSPRMEPMGLLLSDFIIENISLPQEVEKTLDTRTSMGVLGDMGKYTQYQAAEALRDAAQNPGGMAGMGVGMGAGVGLGQLFAQNMQQGASQPAPAPQLPRPNASNAAPPSQRARNSARSAAHPSRHPASNAAPPLPPARSSARSAVPPSRRSVRAAEPPMPPAQNSAWSAAPSSSPRAKTGGQPWIIRNRPPSGRASTNAPAAAARWPTMGRTTACAASNAATLWPWTPPLGRSLNMPIPTPRQPSTSSGDSRR